MIDDTEIRAPRDRGEMAARLGGRAGVQRPEPGSRERRRPRTTGTSSRCCRTRPARASTWATSSTTRWATSRRTCAAAAAGTSCARWAGTRSACRRRTPRSSEGRHPRETIEANIETMRAQMKRLGWAIDWEREVAAHQPTFYRWTQWLFQQFVAHDLCYRREGPVNWCPNDQTVIANEYVVDGHCERCGAEVELRNMTQWFMRTTAYADELLEYDLPKAPTGRRRRRRSSATGSAAPRAPRSSSASRRPGEDIAVFTTRPDTLFGATFFVVAPEHPFVDAHASDEAKEYARHAGTRLGRGARGGDEEDRRLHRPPRGQPDQRRTAADLGRRLRPHGLRNGRDHGRPRARRARRRVRGERSRCPSSR